MAHTLGKSFSVEQWKDVRAQNLLSPQPPVCVGGAVSELREINLVSLQQPEHLGQQLRKFKHLDEQQRKIQTLFHCVSIN